MISLQVNLHKIHVLVYEENNKSKAVNFYCVKPLIFWFKTGEVFISCSTKHAATKVPYTPARTITLEWIEVLVIFTTNCKLFL